MLCIGAPKLKYNTALFCSKTFLTIFKARFVLSIVLAPPIITNLSFLTVLMFISLSISSNPVIRFTFLLIT